ncbi:MAG: MotA/TolQ/ExbB proton channel [Planctomycetaceae bacterium]|nr:MotA/TolQ/ExbB proton channel [Planctomycetaceae bacterium]
MRLKWNVDREPGESGRRWQPSLLVSAICLAFAVCFLDASSVKVAWGQVKKPASVQPDETSLEPLAPNDQAIQIDADDPGAPPAVVGKNRSNPLRKALAVPGVADENVPEKERVAAPPDDAVASESPAPVAGAKSKKLLIPTDPVGLFIAGGHLMPLILMASIISLWFGLERMVALRWGRVIPRAFVDRFLQHLEQGKLTPETALRLCEENNSPMSEVFAHGVRKWGKTSVEVEQAIIDGGERQVSQLRTHLRIINGVATIAPLLGLLGTVFGMIMSFNELAKGSDVDRGERLAYGIGVALITTAAGLIVAIPSLVLYMCLSGRVDRLVMDMDQLAQKVVNLISAEALASRPRVSTPKPVSAVAMSGPATTPPGKPKPVGT